ncbi:transposase, partial [Microcystis aeruginosa]
QAADDERIRNCIEGKFGQGKRRFSLGKVMAKLPHTSFSAIAITFLVMNLSNLLRQVFWAFLCLKWKNSTFSRSMIRISYDLKINQQLKLMLVAK